MRKIIIILIVFVFSIQANLFSQIIKKTADASGKTTYEIDVNARITNLGSIIEPGDLHLRGIKRTVPWIEYGDGAFSTRSVSSHLIVNQTKPTLVFATGIYDTTKPYQTRIASIPPPTSVTSTSSFLNSSNEIAVLPPGKNIFITPNVRDIVPGDYNNFAITYKATDDTAYYKIDFYYNSQPVFKTIDDVTLLPDGSSMIRLFYGDHLSGEPPSVKAGFSKSITIVCEETTLSERNIFISAKADPLAELNSATSIYVVLSKKIKQPAGPWVKVDDYTINSMPVAIAHDPNYIRQTGQCILLPKAEKLVKYHIHFQNDGQGEAGMVDVNVKLPRGIDNSNIKYGSANCGGNPFVFTKDNVMYDENTLTLTFKFENKTLPYLLKGTLENVNPFTNPNTMGDIFFSVKESVITTDTLPAVAEIFFYNINSGTRLSPISTNLALSVYKNACDGKWEDIKIDTAKYWQVDVPCKNCSPITCKKILGICWYWWLLLFLLLTCLYWWYRKNKKEDEDKSSV